MMTWKWAVLAAALLASVPAAATKPTAEFAVCDDAGAAPLLAGSLCLTESVALDPAAPAGEQAELFVRKFPAENRRRRRGAVWLVAGGPGETGAAFYHLLPVYRRAFPDFDLIVPDHRGTGFSTKICPAEEAPESPDGIALAGAEWGPCIGSSHASAARTKSFTVTHAARDLATLIARHRTPGRTYVYGVSYGTQLVLRMLAAAPVRLDGVILDGLVPPDGSAEADLGRRTAIVDAVGRSLLSAEQATAYARVLARPGGAWHDVVPGGDLRQFMGSLLNFPALRAQIPAVIAGLDAGDPAPLAAAVAGLKAEAAALGGFVQSPSSIPLVIVISGSENNARRDLDAETVTAEAKDALFTSPLPGLLAGAPLPLYDRDPWYGKLPEKIPPTLIIQGTRDPNTPYEAARTHADLLAKAGKLRFVSVTSGAHFLALVAPDCFAAAASAFVGSRRPATRCAAGD